MSPSAEEPQTRRRGRPPRSAEARAAQRARLTDAAFTSLRAHGPDVSLDQLAADAGVSKPSLYDEFGGKSGIADAIAVVLAEELEARVLARIASAGSLDIAAAIGWIIDGLVEIIDREPAAYAFIVRDIRTSDRGFLDNALVRAVHDRARLLVGLAAVDVPEDRLAVLLDGLFGFVFAAVESWHSTRRPARGELIEDLSVVVTAAVMAVAARDPAHEEPAE